MADQKGAWERGVDWTADNLGYAIVRFSPLVGAFPSIGTILASAEAKGIAVFIVVGIELVGYALGDAAVKAFENKTLPSRTIQIIVGMYLACIEGLMLGYSVIPAWTAWYAGTASIATAVQATASIIYPFFTLAGAGLYAFHKYLDMKKEEGDRERAKVEEEEKQRKANSYDLELERQRAELEAYKLKLTQDLELKRVERLAKVEKRSPIPPPVKEEKEDRPAPVPDRELQLAALFQFEANPKISDSKLAEALGCSKRKAQGLVDELSQLGVIEIEKLPKGKVVTLNGNSEAFKKGEL